MMTLANHPLDTNCRPASALGVAWRFKRIDSAYCLLTGGSRSAGRSAKLKGSYAL
jgi:hypothetical protein